MAVQVASRSAQPEVEPSTGNVRIEAAGLTDVGQHRDTNEDAFLIATLQRTLVIHDASPAARGWIQGEPAGTLLIVADGMGGMGGGDRASDTAVTSVTQYLLNVMPWTQIRATSCAPQASGNHWREELSSALVAGDQSVKAVGAQTSTPFMGTTLTMAFVIFPCLYVAHVGDTRCYLLRAGKLRALTTDHNMAQKLAEESGGTIQPPAHFQDLLWNSLGASDHLPRPDVSKLELETGDSLLLCSDGLNKHVTDERIENVLANGKSCAARSAELVELANAEGGTDNVTVVVAQLHAAD